MNDTSYDENRKPHRSRHSGRKAEKKKEKKQPTQDQDLTDRQRNPKAFAFNSAVGAERRFRRKQDIATKKQHIPLVDRTPIEPPPILIAVVGPPKVGKTTLINNLVKLFSKSPLTDIKGPVTLVTGKKRRITLIECNNDINSMIDLAKVADLALLLCDASFGFEMEVFEFLSICQVHGMPRIMGILTHLDMIKNNKTLKNTKKTLKHRFWTEVYPGAKLFYLSGILHGEYLRNEIKNLGRFISIMKFRPLTWKMSHSYLLADRYEDLTNLELVRQNSKCDRNISLYGYIRGIPLNKGSSVHIAGYGDIKIHDISYLPDPCPLPETIKKRALVEREKFIYAPFSGVGGIVYDKDAVYVELAGSHSHTNKNNYEASNIVTNLIETKETLDIKLQNSQLQLFSGGKILTANDIDYSNKQDNSLEDNITNYTESVDGVDIINENFKTRIEESRDDMELNNELQNLREHKRKDEAKCSTTKRSVIFGSSDDNSNTEDDCEDAEKESYHNSIKISKDLEVHSKVSTILKTLEKGGMNRESLISASESTNQTKASEDEDSDTEFDSDSSISEDEDYNSDLLKIENKDTSDSTHNMTNHVDVVNTQDEGTSDEEESDSDGEMGVKWKDDLAEKAKQAYLDRLKTNKSIMKIVYGVFDGKYESLDIQESVDNDDDDEIGGLFRAVSKQKSKIEKDSTDLMESSLSMPWSSTVQNFIDPQVKWTIQDCFVTGKWKESEDASELLKLDATEIPSDSDEFGDFEDLETGEKFTAKAECKPSTKRKREVQDDEMNKRALIEKKLKLKQKFDAEYDNTDATYYDELKLSASKQAELNKSVFENMTDDLRVQIEGYRPGMYVRIEFQKVASEFVTNFDPTYPIVIGALNMGEENIGYVNVKVKKHRWYKKILKANDPLIVSLGWRRFQTLPLYTKLEDDLKFRYLKYTPEHLGCNAHFWGPITPQGTGFIALQTCEGNPEIMKHQGFRIAATGAVQELDKSTKILKKLKLVGYPMKIYKKTAFIKGMFNSSLEVAKFEGAKIKTVSGIRGQIKKAVSKPEGCFRATFEDKIQLSDIIFCRTWYKVDVQHFYAPVTTLLLPHDKKNSWKGIRTKGQLKRELNIQNVPDKDSLYREIFREEKVFKPLVIPKKLQQALPYKDKPNHGTKATDKKANMDRVAVIKEPYEQKVSKVMKMIKAAYNHKQEQLKVQTKERLQKHRTMIEAVETNKGNKLKKFKKEVFRARSKRQLREERKGRNVQKSQK